MMLSDLTNVSFEPLNVKQRLLIKDYSVKTVE
jgi:hypothetical protein